MSDMKRQVQKGWLAASGAAVWLAAGCASVTREAPQEFADASPAATNVIAEAAAAVTNAPPAEGYAWDVLARLAAANCSEAKALLLDALAERQKTDVDTGWRNPQLRVGNKWGDSDQSTPGRTGMRTYPAETDTPTRPFNSNPKWDESSFDSQSVALRVYTANPFVNRWLRKSGSSAARAIEAQSQEASYAVFCEVRSLCLEAEMARAEIDLMEQMALFRKQTRDFRKEQSEAGVAGALELIRAETLLASVSSEIHERQTARQQVLRRISVLTGVPVEQLRLRPPDFGKRLQPEYLDRSILTDLAFMRRPDLTRAQNEKEAAEYRVKAARAGQIPWFEYVEGTVESEDSKQNSYEQFVSGHDVTSEDRTEWEVRMAVTVPVFNWLGDEVKLSRTQLAAASSRVEGLYETIRAEVGGVLEDYLAARAERDRLAEEYGKLQETINVRLDALAKESTVRREDVLAAREDLAAYHRICMKAERECLRMEQYLETVSGGSLTSER